MDLSNLNKKGITPFNFLVMAIIILVMAMVLIFFQSDIIKFLTSTASDNLCKTSAYAQDFLKVSGEDIFETMELDCPTRIVKVDNEKDVLPVVAEELYTCWDNFGQGKLELFKPESGLYCVPCANIEFEGLNGYHPGLMKYLLVNKVPGGKQTYFEFLNGVSFKDDTYKNIDSVFQNVDQKSIYLEKPLVVMFTYGKQANWDKKLLAFYGFLTSTVTSSIGGIFAVAEFGFLPGITVLGLGPVTTTALVGAVGITTIALTTSYAGYWLGSDTSADWDAKVLIIPYTEEGMKKLNCQYLPIRGDKSVIVER